MAPDGADAKEFAMSARYANPLRFPGPPSKVCLRIFLSHSWGNERRSEIHSLIQNTGEWTKGIDYQDFSITSAHPIHESNTRDLYRAIARIIAGCDVFIVPAGMEGAYSEWMDREIYAASAREIPIIAVTPNGQERRWSLAQEMADERVGWRGGSIRDAILRRIPDAKRAAFETQQARYSAAGRMQAALAPPPPLDPSRLLFAAPSLADFGPPNRVNALAASNSPLLPTLAWLIMNSKKDH
jgi:hypothetical protein